MSSNREVPGLPKLVRDRVPADIEASGATPQVRSLSPAEFDQAARRKLIEEATEVAGAQTRAEVVAELSDLAEIMAALMDLHQIELAEVEQARASRRAKAGGFRDWLSLEGVVQRTRDQTRPANET